MKTIFCLLMGFLSLGATAQITATVNGHIMVAGTVLPVPNHMVEVVLSGNDSTGSGIAGVVLTDMDGYYSFTATVEGVEGYMQVSTEVCSGQWQTELMQVAANAVNNFTVDFYTCGNMGCQADFYYYQTSAYTYQFMNMSTGNNLSYQWSFGDGTYSAEENPVKTYTAPGVFEVILSVADSGSACSSTISQLVYVGDSTWTGCQASFRWMMYPNSNEVSFYGDVLNFPPENIDNWQWDFGDGQSAIGQNPVHTYAQTGAYNVCLTIASADSSCYSSSCQLVEFGVTPVCQAQFTWYPDSANMELGLQFYDFSFGEINSWYWDFGDGTVSTEQNPVHVYPEPGMYQVCLSIDGPGCQSMWCEQIPVGVTNPECYNYFTYSSSGNTVQLEGFHSSGQPAEFQWDFGDGSVQAGNPVSHTYNAPGIYFVTLTSWDANNCMATSAQSILVGDSASFNQVYGQVFEGNTLLTSGFVMIFSFEADSVYMPYFNVVPVDEDGSFSFPVVPNGIYNLMAVPTDGSSYLPTYYESTPFWQEADSVRAGITANPVNISLVNSQGNPGTGTGTIYGQVLQAGTGTGLIGQMVVYLTDAQFNIIGFTHVGSGGAFIFSDLPFGTYYIKPELAGVNSEYIKVVLSEGQAEIAMDLTFAGNSLYGIPDRESHVSEISIFPNPVHETARITVTSRYTGNAFMMLTDLSGRQIKKRTISKDTESLSVELPVTDLASGMYILKVLFGNGTDACCKLIKR